MSDDIRPTTEPDQRPCETCGGECLHDTNEFSAWCSADCADASTLTDSINALSHEQAVALLHAYRENMLPQDEHFMASLIRDLTPTCCDFHAAEGHIEAAASLPCATWQGGSNYSPNFEGAEHNDLFRSHVMHHIDTNGHDLARLILGWDDLPCPADCGDNVEFNRDGDCIEVLCDCCEVEAIL